jgi:hypothetical protein
VRSPKHIRASQFNFGILGKWNCHLKCFFQVLRHAHKLATARSKHKQKGRLESSRPQKSSNRFRPVSIFWNKRGQHRRDPTLRCPPW